jgi:hypothetical protein
LVYQIKFQDVGMHFVKTGGFNGFTEYYERMVARMIPFRKRFKPINLIEKLSELKDNYYNHELKSVCLQSFDDSRTTLNEIKTEFIQFDIMLIL